jgi:hypothetical protein
MEGDALERGQMVQRWLDPDGVTVQGVHASAKSEMIACEENG